LAKPWIVNLVLIVFLAACNGFKPPTQPAPSSTPAEDDRYLTPIPRSTFEAYRDTQHIANRLDAVIAARKKLEEPHLRYVGEPHVILAERMLLSEARRLFPETWTDAPENHLPDPQVWLVVFEGDWQIDSPPEAERTQTPGLPFHACTYALFENPAGGPSALGNRVCPPSLETTPDALPEIPAQTPSPDTAPLDLSALLEIFPLSPGTSWSYTHSAYSQSISDPDQIVSGVSQIVETVAGMDSYPLFTLVHIRGSKTLLRSDPGWEESGTAGLGDYEYWLILQSDSVYRSDTRPDPANLQTGQLLEEYRFPLFQGSNWCPNKLEKGVLTPPPETPVPCAYAGLRTVENEETHQTPAGSFEHCFRMTDQFNSGSFIQWFCEGVGVVARKYDHLGTRFGFTQELTGFP